MFENWYGFDVKDDKLKVIAVTKAAGDGVRFTLEIKLPVRRGAQLVARRDRSVCIGVKLSRS